MNVETCITKWENIRNNLVKYVVFAARSDDWLLECSRHETIEGAKQFVEILNRTDMFDINKHVKEYRIVSVKELPEIYLSLFDKNKCNRPNEYGTDYQIFMDDYVKHQEGKITGTRKPHHNETVKSYAENAWKQFKRMKRR